MTASCKASEEPREAHLVVNNEDPGRARRGWVGVIGIQGGVGNIGIHPPSSSMGLSSSSSGNLKHEKQPILAVGRERIEDFSNELGEETTRRSWMVFYSILFGIISSYCRLLLFLVDPWCFTFTTTLCLEVVPALRQEEYPVLGLHLLLHTE
jgi:hypothetical protein